MSAEPWITYKRADGDLIAGEYSFVTELDWWQEHDLDEPVQILEQRWELVGERTITIKPSYWDDLMKERIEESCEELGFTEEFAFKVCAVYDHDAEQTLPDTQPLLHEAAKADPDVRAVLIKAGLFEGEVK